MDWRHIVGAAATGAVLTGGALFLGGQLGRGTEDRIEKENEELKQQLAAAEGEAAHFPAVEADRDAKGIDLYDQAKKVIAGGVGLLSKRPENHLPGQWPSYYAKIGPGPYVTDLSGNRYMEVAYGTCYSSLGFHDPDVDSAVKAAVDRGVMGTLNVPQEVELAKELIGLHPWAEKSNGMVRYARGGGEVNTLAIRIARAHTGKDKIVFCGYHGWADFYLAANVNEQGSAQDGIAGHQLTGLEPNGVPKGLGGSMLGFKYNDIEGLRKVMTDNKGKVAAILMEPMRSHEPKEGFLEEVRRLVDTEKKTGNGCVLIFDEVSAAFRETLGGRHLLYSDRVEPDMCTFAKALSNGYAMAAVLGRGEIMQAAQSTFMSSSYWTESIGPSAALATIRKMKSLGKTDDGEWKLFAHLKEMGRMVKKGWSDAAQEHGLRVNVGGIDTWPSFGFDHNEDVGNEANRVISSLFKQEMLKRGFLAGGQFMIMYTHKKQHIEEYVAAVGTVFQLLASWIKDAKEQSGSATDALQQNLKGELEFKGFERLCS